MAIEHASFRSVEMARCVHLLPDTDDAGAENQALALLAGLAGRPELELELVYYGAGRNHQRFVDLGIPVRQIPRRARLIVDLPRRIRALRRLYRDAPPAILHTWM